MTEVTLTRAHMEALEQAQMGVPQEWTCVVAELRGWGYLEHGRYYLGEYGQGWVFTPTTRGWAALYPQAVATGNSKGVATWATWMD